MDLKDLYFPVEKIPIEDILPGYGHLSGNSHAIVATPRKGEKIILNHCSDVYHLVKNEDVFPALYNEISKYFPVEVKVNMISYSRFYVDFIIKNKPHEIIKKDMIFPRIRAVNSYDSAKRFQYYAGMWRLVCLNGMMVPASEMVKINSLHTPKVGKETSFEKVIELAHEIVGKTDLIMDIYSDISDQMVRNPQDRILEVSEFTNFPASLLDEVFDRYMIENKLTNQNNDWLIYNAFNYQLNHNMDIALSDDKREKIDQEILQYLIKY